MFTSVVHSILNTALVPKTQRNERERKNRNARRTQNVNRNREKKINNKQMSQDENRKRKKYKRNKYPHALLRKLCTIENLALFSIGLRIAISDSA